MVKRELLGTELIVQSDSSRKEQPVVSLLQTPWMEESAAEGAVQ